MNKSVDKSASNEPLQLKDYLRLFWPVFLMAGLFVVGQWPMFKSWWAVWDEKESYYSHGPLVPFIAAFMLWTNKDKLAKAKSVPSWSGLILLGLFLPVYALGLIMDYRALFGLAFFLCVFGSLLLLFGKQITKIAAVPILFLVTMIPLASSVLDNLTFRTQLVSSTVATKFLQFILASDVTQQGNQICSSSIPGGILLVGTPCSGLRLLISLITFTWFFIYIIRAAWWKKAILLATSLPLTVFINSLRITMIGCVGAWTESSQAMHRFHDYSGYIGLIICFIILFGIAKILKASNFYLVEPGRSIDVLRKQFSKPIGSGATGLVLSLMLGIGVLAGTTIKPIYNLPRGNISHSSIPTQFSEWVGQDLPIDKATKKALAKGDLTSRLYSNVDDSSRQVLVFMDASLDMSAFHDPHLCLPGGGSPVTQDRIITISFLKPKPLTVRATILETTSDYGTGLIIYWYMLGDKSFPRTADANAISRTYKQDDLKRLILNPCGTSNIRQDILSRQYTWYRFSTDIIDSTNDQEFLVQFIKEFVANTRDFGQQLSRH